MPYIGNNLRSNNDYKTIDDISSSFNGSTTSFSLLVGGVAPTPFPKYETQLLISVGGVIQEPDSSGSSGFQLSGTNIVLVLLQLQEKFFWSYLCRCRLFKCRWNIS